MTNSLSSGPFHTFCLPIPASTIHCARGRYEFFVRRMWQNMAEKTECIRAPMHDVILAMSAKPLIYGLDSKILSKRILTPG